MRLSEAIEQLKYYQSKPYVPTVKKVCNIALETIEALRQENNGWRERYDELDAGHSRLFKDFCKLQQENEQLQAQLDEWKYEAKCHMDEVIAREKQIEQLRAQVARMREALEKAREALDYWREPYGIGLEVLNWHMNGNTEPFDSFYDNSGTYEALVEIDKAIGGGQE